MNIQTKLLQLAINYINEVMATECMYCFGTRNTLQTTKSIFADPGMEQRTSIHFDMLVVTTNNCPLPDFIGKLDNIKDMEVTVSLIVSTHAALQTALQHNNRFFHSIVRKGKLVHTKIGKTPIHPGHFDEEKDRSTTRKYWDKCYKNGMASLHSALHNYHHIDIAIPLYTKNLTQICEGLIFVCLGYTPSGYSLEQMLDLCNSIDLHFDGLIPKITERNIFNYHILMQGSWKKEKGNEMEPFINEIHSCCEEFSDYAKVLCEAKLNATNYVGCIK
ncbi:hypothetical protein ACSBL2_07445 [Pedobacter sp. AW31-3R]|uniref:hypothetical protein n=1 Tax=Pedobacter sp. AW31-3R TaxID=3445781 RepID=UPI003F9FB242